MIFLHAFLFREFGYSYHKRHSAKGDNSEIDNNVVSIWDVYLLTHTTSSRATGKTPLVFNLLPCNGPKGQLAHYYRSFKKNVGIVHTRIADIPPTRHTIKHG